MNWKQEMTCGLLAPGIWAGRVPETWETVAEGTCTTEQRETNGFVRSIGEISAPGFFETFYNNGNCYDGDVRITVNGASAVVPTDMPLKAFFYAGNAWLESGNHEDDGYDYLIRTAGYDGDFVTFYSRYPGTYNIKIEKRVT